MGLLQYLYGYREVHILFELSGETIKRAAKKVARKNKEDKSETKNGSRHGQSERVREWGSEYTCWRYIE